MADNRTPHRHFGDVFRDFRNRCQMTQGEVAAAVGVTETYVSLLENGHRRPSRGLIDRLSEALALDAEDRNRLFLEAGYERPSSQLSMTPPHLAYRALRRLISISPESDDFGILLAQLVQTLLGADLPAGGSSPVQPGLPLDRLTTAGYYRATPRAPRDRGSNQASASGRRGPSVRRDQLAAELCSLLQLLGDPHIGLARRIAAAKELVSFAEWKLRRDPPASRPPLERTV